MNEFISQNGRRKAFAGLKTERAQENSFNPEPKHDNNLKYWNFLKQERGQEGGDCCVNDASVSVPVFCAQR
jgi:hypothetical protein